jgi:enolase-like protein
MAGPRVRVREIRLYERALRLRMPFRFGVATFTQGVQAFARVRVEREDGSGAWGSAAEMLGAKWFDKDLALTDAENLQQLRRSLAIASELYLAAGSRTPFAFFAETYRAQIERCASEKLNALIAGYGPAMLDRAVLDAVCRLAGLSFQDAIRSNLPGLAAGDLTPDLGGFDLDRFLSVLTPADTIQVRHTVGLVDAIADTDLEGQPRVADGLPETLEAVVATYGNRYFKLKVGGDVGQDVARLTAIARVLDRIPEPYRVSLDGNEQYKDVDGVLALWNAIASTPALARLSDAILFVEQPITRTVALDADVSPLAAARPVIIDESDADLDSFPRARGRGYAGVSSKTCKGFYKSILNRARCARWNADAGTTRYFMSAEDLTTQPGVSVQQDLALVSLLGLTHVEKNAHHYVNGMSSAPREEQQAFLGAHPDLYEEQDGVVRLRIRNGRVSLGSLGCVGFATAAEPDWSRMRPMSV